ncbi:RNA recognition motif domain-containing protein [Rhizosphaericola mali]|uniref:RNA-binding protein n=1 Tax=Rhizosphaericola mali TaxID=2545455 RepID=A0A5P2G480_9BACT|nr:RNA-binding protein [Rhizosphaericola mali]QES90315.1 RNA-binding protein [Rhizosphaericola mali]
MNIYVSSLSYSVNNDDLKELFEDFGEVVSANIINDKFTQRSRGFGFVEMPNIVSANKAINSLDGSKLDGRTINVSEAKEKEPRSNNYSNRVPSPFKSDRNKEISNNY